MQNLKKFREEILKLSIGNGADGRTDRRTDRRTDTEGYNIIPRHTLVAGYNDVIHDVRRCNVVFTLERRYKYM